MSNSTSSNIISWKNSPLFDGISEAQLKHLEGHLMEATYHTGDYLIKEGTFGDAIFFIEIGNVKIQKDEVLLAEKRAGDYVGAMALMENTTRSADVIADEPTSVKVLTINQLKAIEADEIYYKVLNNHLKEQQALLRKMNDATIQKAKAKIKEAELREQVFRRYFYVTLALLILLSLFLIYTHLAV